MRLPMVQLGCSSCRMRLLLLLGCLLVHLRAGVTSSMALDFPGTVSCHTDKMLIGFPRELGSIFWQVLVVDASGAELVDCDYRVDHEKMILTAPYVNCTRLEHDKHQLRMILLLKETIARDKNVTYSIGCAALQADEVVPTVFTSTTNCTKDFMAVVFPRLIPSFADEHMTTESQMTWIISIDDGTRMHRLTLQQAMQQGYTFLADSDNLIFQASFGATGVTSYTQDNQMLYTVALKLSYGPPNRQLTVESRMICAPGPATCNSTHMTVAIPAFPGILTAVSMENRNIPLNQLQANEIALDTQKGVKLHINRRILKSRLDESCLRLKSYLTSLKLTFNFNGETVSMVTYPECRCDQHAPIAAVCTQEGYMDFEVHSDMTKPALDLDSIKLRDPACKPAFKSSSEDLVRFHVPLNSCGTRHRFEGERTTYENEVHALWANLPPHRISRDSELRLTVVCMYSNGDAALNVRMSSLPPPVSSINQGPLSLILLIYPDNSYLEPYRDDQNPIVKHLQQPIFLEVQVLNRNDPNIKLVLDDCWATTLQDPRSLPRWNIVVDGCDYELDNYRTVFHPVGLAVSYPNYRQRFEVKAFAFVSGDKALTSLVYFHCSALLCDRLQPDSPLCSTRCPRSARNKRDVVMQAENSGVASLPSPVVLLADEWPSIQGREQIEETWTAVATAATVVILGLMAAVLVLVGLLKCRTKAVMRKKSRERAEQKEMRHLKYIQIKSGEKQEMMQRGEELPLKEELCL
ncbi:zona pellucida sperm-binding protein 2-like [Carettochelys insculpta]|uniref:zona pellucida sperm-binding protein 2-like n=1 Tax=Carettochelys insculpta TaxID=44489 RepID=UPI003EBEE9A3